MALYPFNHPVLPGVYGPVQYPVRLIEEGKYYIKGYSTTEFKGTPRDIAKQIILEFTLRPETDNRKNYVGPFYLRFEPELSCDFIMDAIPEPPDLDTNVLAKDISEELKSLSKLILFS